MRSQMKRVMSNGKDMQEKRMAQKVITIEFTKKHNCCSTTMLLTTVKLITRRDVKAEDSSIRRTPLRIIDTNWEGRKSIRKLSCLIIMIWATMATCNRRWAS